MLEVRYEEANKGSSRVETGGVNLPSASAEGKPTDEIFGIFQSKIPSSRASRAGDGMLRIVSRWESEACSCCLCRSTTTLIIISITKHTFCFVQPHRGPSLSYFMQEQAFLTLRTSPTKLHHYDVQSRDQRRQHHGAGNCTTSHMSFGLLPFFLCTACLPGVCVTVAAPREAEWWTWREGGTYTVNASTHLQAPGNISHHDPGAYRCHVGQGLRDLAGLRRAIRGATPLV